MYYYFTGFQFFFQNISDSGLDTFHLHHHLQGKHKIASSQCPTWPHCLHHSVPHGHIAYITVSHMATLIISSCGLFFQQWTTGCMVIHLPHTPIRKFLLDFHLHTSILSKHPSGTMEYVTLMFDLRIVGQGQFSNTNPIREHNSLSQDILNL